MRAVLVQNMLENMQNLAKYVLKYAAYMWHYGNMQRKWRVRVLDKMRRNAEKCDRICGNMRLYANFFI